MKGFIVVLTYEGEYGEKQREIRAATKTEDQAKRLAARVPLYGSKVSVEQVEMDGREFFDLVSPERDTLGM